MYRWLIAALFLELIAIQGAFVGSVSSGGNATDDGSVWAMDGTTNPPPPPK